MADRKNEPQKSQNRDSQRQKAEAKQEEEINRELAQIARRKELNARFGYDIDRERLAVIRAAQPITGRLLEAGTGRGHLAVNLARLGYRLVSFDFSAEQLEFARQNLEANNLAQLVELRQEDGEKLSFPDGSFEVIFSVNMIHHLQNAFRVIDELNRVLAPGGKLVISDFNPEGLAMMAEIHRLEGDEHQVSPVGIDEVEKYLKARGFKVKKTGTGYQIILVASRDSKFQVIYNGRFSTIQMKTN
jgi:2-polyprenyl-3-methyl-5-hydroxy-6-metoxy-1,4-benzoquinol methylase